MIRLSHIKTLGSRPELMDSLLEKLANTIGRRRCFFVGKFSNPD